MRGRGSFLCSSQVAAGPDRAGGAARGEQGAAPRLAATAPGAAPSRRPGGAACGPAPPGGAGPAGCTRPPGASRRCPGAEALGRPLPASSPPPARARGRRCLRLIAAARRLPPLCREGRGRRDPAGDMGNGMCSRKQKRIFQTLVLLTVVFSFIYGAMLYYELQSQLRKAEATALKYQQHQESLSAQLQGTAARLQPRFARIPLLRGSLASRCPTACKVLLPRSFPPSSPCQLWGCPAVGETPPAPVRSDGSDTHRIVGVGGQLWGS